MRTRLAVLLPLAVVLLAAAVAAGAAPAPRGVGFELKRTSVSPKHPTFDATREIRLHYGFAANRPVDLRIEVRRARSGNGGPGLPGARRSPGPAAGPRLERPQQARQGRRRRPLRVPRRSERRGDEVRRPASGCRTHVFPVDGPHGTRGAIGEFGAPRSGGRVHEGFDITADCGTPLIAARGGTVQKVGYDPVLYGNYVLDRRR